MFGQNPVRKRESRSELQVVEKPWFTIQGEGIYAGHCAVFIRLTGCPLKCVFCDTEWSDQNDLYFSPESLAGYAAEVAPAHCQLVVITGGEPLRQDLDKLIKYLANRFDIIQLETAGVYWQDCLLHHQVRIVVSPKTPKIHPKIYTNAHAFKYVMTAGALGGDGLPILSTQVLGKRAVLARPRPGAPTYLSPCDEYDTAKNTANLQAVVQAAQEYGFIAGIQLHKILNVP